MAVEQDRYNSLIRRCAFNAEFFRGTIQDLSLAQRAMSFVGSPSFSKIAGWPCLKKNANADRTSSGVVASVVDSSGAPFWCEFLFVAPRDTTIFNYLFYHFGGGGWLAYHDTASGRVRLRTLTAVGGVARETMSAVGSSPAGRLAHAIGWLDPVAVTSLWWINGIPSAPFVVNTAPPANCAPSVFNAPGTGDLTMSTMITRVWQGTPSNEDCVTLYQAAKTLVGGEI